MDSSQNRKDSQSINKKKKTFQKILIWIHNHWREVFSILFLTVFISLMLFLGLMQRDPTNLMLQIIYWFQNNLGKIGLYIGVGIISIFGNFVMFIPILYAVVLMFVAVLDVNVFILGISAGIGASIGQIVSWFVGRATGEIIDKKMEKHLLNAQRWIQKGLAPLMIFLFAATPLPDEVLLLMIGLIGYSLLKTLVYCFLGKIVLTVSISVIANFFSKTPFGEWFLVTLFNVSRSDLLTQTIPENSNVWTSIVIWIITASLLVLVTFFDWGKLFEKIHCRRQKKLFQLIFMYIEKNITNNLFQQKTDFLEIFPKKDTAKAFFPDNSLWFLEQSLEKRKTLYLRKGLIIPDAAIGHKIKISFTKNWVQKIQNLFEEKDIFKAREYQIIKFPARQNYESDIYQKAVLIGMTFKMKLFYKLFYELLPTKEKMPKRYWRKKVSLEFLIHFTSNEEAVLTGIGLQEAIFIQQIIGINPEKIMQYLLIPLGILPVNLSLFSSLKIHPVIIGEIKRKLTTLPENLINSCT